MKNFGIYDPLYGEVRFGPLLRGLVLTPAVQRLRGIRLSNVDSLSLTGFAGPSRYEHALGAATVAGCLGFFRNLGPEERLILQAAALIHDTAITPYGHLVEEAFACVEQPFDHEKKWQQLSDEKLSEQPGGAQSQVYMGRESGFQKWAEHAFGRRDWRVALGAVLAAVRGDGEYGPAIAGRVDVDNLDNVTRAAFHMGIPCDKGQPMEVAEAIKGIEDGRPVVDEGGVKAITGWLALRGAVYSRLMTAGLDYSGKAMLLAAATAACAKGVISEESWRYTDAEFTHCILSSGCEDAKKPLQQWLLGELWALTDIVWMKGEMPSLPDTFRFSQEISQEFGRCMAYRIADKRQRKVPLRLTSGKDVAVGKKSEKWLLAVAVDGRKLTRSLIDEILDAAQQAFGAEIDGYVKEDRRIGTLFDA